MTAEEIKLGRPVTVNAPNRFTLRASDDDLKLAGQLAERCHVTTAEVWRRGLHLYAKQERRRTKAKK